jgi:hypothetical protein
MYRRLIAVALLLAGCRTAGPPAEPPARDDHQTSRLSEAPGATATGLAGFTLAEIPGIPTSAHCRALHEEVQVAHEKASVCQGDRDCVPLGGCDGVNKAANIAEIVTLQKRMVRDGCKVSWARVRDPNRKGKKEKSFRLVWDDFLKGVAFASWDDLDERRARWLDDTPDVANRRVHGTTRRVPNEAWLEEKPLLIQLPAQRFPVHEESVRLVDDDATLSIRGTRYTVPAHLAPGSVATRLYAEHFEVLDRHGHVAFSRAYAPDDQKGELIIDRIHYASLPTRRGDPGAGGSDRLDEAFVGRFPSLAPLADGIKQRMKTLAHVHFRALVRTCDRTARRPSWPPPAAPRSTAASTPLPSSASSSTLTLYPTAIRSPRCQALGPPSSARSSPPPSTPTPTWTTTRRPRLPPPIVRPPPTKIGTRTMARSRKRPPAPEPLEELVQLALDLDLTTLATALPDMLRRTEREGLSFTDFALALGRAEVDARRERSLQRSLRRSRLGTIEGLEGFDFQARPQLEPRVIKELLNCRFVDERRNVL